MSNNFYSFPRAKRHDVQQRLVSLRGQTELTVSNLVVTETTGFTFYGVSERKSSSNQLFLARRQIVELAKKYGFPGQRMQPEDSSLSFDQALAIDIQEIFHMHPAEAADDEVWHFITLFLLPDISLWRFPFEPDKNGQYSDLFERYTGTRRGFLKQAWWRGYLLGPKVCSEFLEDEFLNLVDRVGISGNERLAAIAASEHLNRVANTNYKRRNSFREAMKLIRRRLGQQSLYVLSSEQLSKVISDIFDEADRITSEVNDEDHDEFFMPHVETTFVLETQNEIEASNKQSEEDPLEITKVKISVASKPFSEKPSNQAQISEQAPLGKSSANPKSVVEIFMNEAQMYSDILDPLLLNLPDDRVDELRDLLEQVADEFAGHEIVEGIVGDLSDLLLEWPSFTADERKIVYATLAYFLIAEDLIDDRDTDGFVDDDEVVNALFKALNRDRSSK